MAEPEDSNEKGDVDDSRIDTVLSEVRRFHRLAFSTAAFTLAIALAGTLGDFELPSGAVTIPIADAVVFLYLVTIGFTLVAERFFASCVDSLKQDTRTPPFPWFPLSSNHWTTFSVTAWLAVPTVVTAISASVVSDGGQSACGWTFWGVLTIGTPSTIRKYSELIRSRQDHRGGPATYSIILLYRYRLFRTILITAAFILSVVAILPTPRDAIMKLIVPGAVLATATFLVRTVGGFMYGRIDRYGARRGYPIESAHYKLPARSNFFARLVARIKSRGRKSTGSTPDDGVGS